MNRDARPESATASWGASLLFLATTGLLGGCGLFGKPEEKTMDQVQTRSAAERPSLSVGELDQMARNYADRLVARVSTACDQIKREAEGDDVRDRAHQLKLSIALAAYDIVSSSGGSPQVPGAAQHIIDLAILAELEALRWGDEGRAKSDFGEHGGQRLAEAFQQSREDIWQIAGRFVTRDQVDRLKTMITRWHAANPEIQWLARIRLDVIAQGQEGAGFVSALGQTFNPIESATRSIDEVRLVSQQALFYLKRLPTLVDWTTEASLTHALSTPGLGSLVHGLRESLEAVSRLAGEMDHLLQPSSQEPGLNSTVREVRETLAQAESLVREVHRLQEAVVPLMDRFPSSSGPSKKATDYEAVANRVNDAARSTAGLVQETRRLAESPEAARHVDEFVGRLGRDIGGRGREVVDHAFWRLVQIVFLIAFLIAVYRISVYGIRKHRPRSAP